MSQEVGHKSNVFNKNDVENSFLLRFSARKMFLCDKKLVYTLFKQ